MIVVVVVQSKLVLLSCITRCVKRILNKYNMEIYDGLTKRKKGWWCSRNMFVYFLKWTEWSPLFVFCK